MLLRLKFQDMDLLGQDQSHINLTWMILEAKTRPWVSCVRLRHAVISTLTQW